MDKAAFLGPKAENADELERLLLEVLHDHVFWRRNFHPADRRLIGEGEKGAAACGDTAARLRDELFQILAELKRGAPLFSPRQIGHMVSDPSLPGLVGYFAGLLYNQNNVVEEAAPETVQKERLFMAALARMIGYPPMLPEELPAATAQVAHSWGHLASGGTSANLEALWVARNVRLFPLAIRLLQRNEPAFRELAGFEVQPAGGSASALADLTTFELLNLPVLEVTNLYRRIRLWLCHNGATLEQSFAASVPSVRRIGLAGLMQQYNERFPADPLRPPVVVIGQPAHYGWAKAMDVAGLGAGALRLLPVDRRLRLDPDVLAAAVLAAGALEEPVLMTVGILGSTEEGSVDPLHHIEAVRRDVEREGISFWHHVDAAFGGYLAAGLPRDEEDRIIPWDSADEALFEEEVYRAVAAMAQADSVTIDPHKWGYVPYPAGAVLFRDHQVRDAIAYAAPYLHATETSGFGGFLGRWTLEGSRPGAPAVGAFLSQAVLPLDQRGHGALVRRCVQAARTLAHTLREEFASGPDRLILLAEPDTVGFCFVIAPDEPDLTLGELNAFTRRLWEHVNIDGREDIGGYEFILSKTEMPLAAYRHVLAHILPQSMLSFEEPPAIVFLRVFVLNPFVSEWDADEGNFALAFARFLRRVCMQQHEEYRRSGRPASSASSNAHGAHDNRVAVAADVGEGIPGR
jgi:glutamate/tyrosine decarboxylase-like PLP-dependent enzyme